MITTDAILGFDFRQLSVADRKKVIERIEETLVDDAESYVLTDEQRAVLDWRTQDAREHPERLLTLEELKQRLRKGR